MKGTSIRCPDCGYGKNDVKRTMRLTVGNTTHIRRYRKCLKCGLSFRTKEEIDLTEKNIVRSEQDRMHDNEQNDL